MLVKSNMKVLFMPNNVSGVNFWRMFQFWEKMRSKGIDAHIHRYETNNASLPSWETEFYQSQTLREEIYQALMNCDVAVMGYAHNPALISLTEMFRKDFKKKIWCEIDDDVISVPAYNPAYKMGNRPGTHFEKTAMSHMRVANGIITSTDFLKDQYIRFNKNIETIPNCIDTTKWNISKKIKKTKNLTIGWVGGGNHDEDLKIMCDVIPILLKKYRYIEFKFVHGMPTYLRDIDKRVKWINEWSAIDKYPSFVAKQGFDIGIAPLTYNKFNMSKSNLRWLEYSALGIPCVASSIVPYEKSIQNGKTGLLADTAEEWIGHLSHLIESESARFEIGDNAFKEVSNHYNLDDVTDKYIKVLRDNR